MKQGQFLKLVSMIAYAVGVIFCILGQLTPAPNDVPMMLRGVFILLLALWLRLQYIEQRSGGE